MIGLKKCKKNIFNVNKLLSKLPRFKKKKISRQNLNFQTFILTKLFQGFDRINTQEFKNKRMNKITLDFHIIILRL